MTKLIFTPCKVGEIVVGGTYVIDDHDVESYERDDVSPPLVKVDHKFVIGSWVVVEGTVSTDDENIDRYSELIPLGTIISMAESDAT